MSDEPTPPSLRLRPRKRDDEPAPVAAPAVPAAAISAPVETAEPPARFRLKPKLAPEPELKKETVEAAAPVLLQPVMTPPVSAPVAPLTSVTLPSDDSTIHRLKLKAVIPDTEEPPAAPTKSAPSTGGSISIQLPPNIPGSMLVGGLPPVVVKPSASQPPPLKPATAVPLPPVVKPPLPGARPASVPKLEKKKSRTVILGLGLIAILLLGAGGYYYLYMRDDGVTVYAPTSASSKPVTAGTKATTPGSKVAGSAGSTSGGATETPVISKLGPLPPQPTLTKTVSAPVKPIKAGPTNAALSAALRTWINDARITGVVGGDSPRVIINNKLMRPGDMVDATQGIIFDSLDTERKLVIFRTSAGIFGEKTY